MLGRLHILFNLSTAMPFYVYLFLNKYDYNIIIASALILVLFSNFPDIDISNNKKISSKLIRNTFYFFFIILALAIRNRKSIKHRGITHSLQGLIFFSSMIFIIWIFLTELPLELNWFYDLIIPISAITAYALHLVGDAITKEGIDPFMKGKKIRGIIRVGKSDFIYATLYTITQISSLIYIEYSLKTDLIPIISTAITIFFVLFPILVSYTSKDSR